MVFIPALNCAKIAAQYGIRDGDIAVNTHYVVDPAGWSNTKLTQLANAYITWFSAATLGVTPRALMEVTASLLQVEARDLTTQVGPEVLVAPAGGAVAGTNAGGPVQSGLSLAVKSTTGLTGRSYRGRTYVIALPGNGFQTDNNLVTAPTGANWVTALANLRAAIVAASGTWVPVIASFYSGKLVSGRPAPRDTAVLTPITSTSLTDGYVDFQRRRAPAHGRHR